MSLAQLLRLVIQPEVIVAGHQMPLWPSVLALVILGGLSIWLWKLSVLRRDESRCPSFTIWCLQSLRAQRR
jgi:hypothetical protein